MVGKLAKLIILGGMCVLLSAFISGCNPFIPSPEEQAENAAYDLLEAIRLDDAGLLPRIMAKSALDAPDLTQGFDFASSLLNGADVSIGEPTTVEQYSVENGKSSLVYVVWLEVKALDQEYYLRVEYHNKDDFNKSKVGIYRAYLGRKQDYEAEIERIRALRSEASENAQPLPEWNYGATYERAGIYHPGWKDEAKG